MSFPTIVHWPPLHIAKSSASTTLCKISKLILVICKENEENTTHKAQAKKVYAHLQSLSTTMGTRDASRVALFLSRWGNLLHMQYKQLKDIVTTSMVKEVWTCLDIETNKGR